MEWTNYEFDRAAFELTRVEAPVGQVTPPGPRDVVEQLASPLNTITSLNRKITHEMEGNITRTKQIF